jgi:hypothetical protein
LSGYHECHSTEDQNDLADVGDYSLLHDCLPIDETNMPVLFMIAGLRFSEAQLPDLEALLSRSLPDNDNHATARNHKRLRNFPCNAGQFVEELSVRLGFADKCRRVDSSKFIIGVHHVTMEIYCEERIVWTRQRSGYLHVVNFIPFDARLMPVPVIADT